MLTKTQLRAAKIAELERLKARIESELDKRREQEGREERRQQQKTEPKERLFFSSRDGHYQWEFRECGQVFASRR